MLKTLLTLFCTALFFVMVYVVPVRADHLQTAPYVCTSLEDAIESVRLQETENMDELRTRAEYDPAFKCMFIQGNIPFRVLEIVYEYTAYGIRKAVVRGFDAAGTEVYLFGPIDGVLKSLHRQAS